MAVCHQSGIDGPAKAWSAVKDVFTAREKLSDGCDFGSTKLLKSILLFVACGRHDIQYREIYRPEGKQRPPRKIGAPIGRATAFDQICRTSGRHDRRTGPFFGDKYYCASAPDDDCARPLARHGRLILFRG